MASAGKAHVMKVRLGVGFLGWPFAKKDPQLLWDYIDMVEDSAADSIWLADRIVAPAYSMESMTIMAAIAARTKRMKFGNSVLALPLRNPAVLAKEIATVDFISKGRMLPAVGLGTDSPNEFEACGSNIKQRAGRTDEALDLMRKLWSEDDVTFEGRYYTVHDATIQPKPHQDPMPVWIGGRTEPAFRRVGRRGDGWLTASLTPDEVGHGIERIHHYAEEAGRTVPDDHFGTIISFRLDDSKAKAVETAAPYLMGRLRPELDPFDYAAIGTPDDIAAMVQRYVDNGATKFVLRHAGPPEETLAQTERAARDVIAPFHR